MTFNYTAFQASAGQLIQNFGNKLTFTRTTKGAYDPNTGTTTDSSSTYQKFACVFEYSDAERADELVEQGDRRLLAEGHEYKINDTVEIESETYRIISINHVQPASTIVASNLQVRK